MLYAQNIFLHDVGKKTWSEAKKEYGVSIEESLRTYAHVLKTTVKQNDIKDTKNRPRNYYQWIRHLKGKVCYLFKQIQKFF